MKQGDRELRSAACAYTCACTVPRACTAHIHLLCVCTTPLPVCRGALQACKAAALDAATTGACAHARAPCACVCSSSLCVTPWERACRRAYSGAPVTPPALRLCGTCRQRLGRWQRRVRPHAARGRMHGAATERVRARCAAPHACAPLLWGRVAHRTVPSQRATGSLAGSAPGTSVLLLLRPCTGIQTLCSGSATRAAGVGWGQGRVCEHMRGPRLPHKPSPLPARYAPVSPHCARWGGRADRLDTQSCRPPPAHAPCLWTGAATLRVPYVVASCAPACMCVCVSLCVRHSCCVMCARPPQVAMTNRQRTAPRQCPRQCRAPNPTTHAPLWHHRVPATRCTRRRASSES